MFAVFLYDRPSDSSESRLDFFGRFAHNQPNIAMTVKIVGFDFCFHTIPCQLHAERSWFVPKGNLSPDSFTISQKGETNAAI